MIKLCWCAWLQHHGYSANTLHPGPWCATSNNKIMATLIQKCCTFSSTSMFQLVLYVIVRLLFSVKGVLLSTCEVHSAILIEFFFKVALKTVVTKVFHLCAGQCSIKYLPGIQQRSQKAKLHCPNFEALILSVIQVLKEDWLWLRSQFIKDIVYQVLTKEHFPAFLAYNFFAWWTSISARSIGGMPWLQMERQTEHLTVESNWKPAAAEMSAQCRLWVYFKCRREKGVGGEAGDMMNCWQRGQTHTGV